MQRILVDIELVRVDNVLGIEIAWLCGADKMLEVGAESRDFQSEPDCPQATDNVSATNKTIRTLLIEEA